MMLMPGAGRGAASTAAVLVRVLPLVVVSVLTAPAWLCFAFLSPERRASVLDLLAGLIAWSGAASEPRGHPRREPTPGGRRRRGPAGGSGRG